MLSRTGILIGGLGIAVVALAVALGVALATGDDDNDDHSMLMNQGGYAGMMGAMGSMDSDAMLQQMRGVLGEDAFKVMQQHMQDHKPGAAMTGNSSIDQMMHTMMDGMMGQIGLVPKADERHETPAAPSASPTTAR